jgi:hypothetical protein
MTNPESFGYYVHEHSMSFHFLNDKEKDGVKKKIYKLNQRDKDVYKETKKLGSIVGTKFNVTLDNDGKKTEYIEAVLFISTYGKKSTIALWGCSEIIIRIVSKMMCCLILK